MKLKDITPGAWYLCHSGASWRDEQLLWIPEAATPAKVFWPSRDSYRTRAEYDDHGTTMMSWPANRQRIGVPEGVSAIAHNSEHWRVTSIGRPSRNGSLDRYDRAIQKRSKPGDPFAKWDTVGYAVRSATVVERIWSDADLVRWLADLEDKLTAEQAADEALQNERLAAKADAEAARDRLPDELVRAVGGAHARGADWIEIERLWNEVQR